MAAFAAGGGGAGAGCGLGAGAGAEGVENILVNSLGPAGAVAGGEALRLEKAPVATPPDGRGTAVGGGVYDSDGDSDPKMRVNSPSCWDEWDATRAEGCCRG